MDKNDSKTPMLKPVNAALSGVGAHLALVSQKTSIGIMKKPDEKENRRKTTFAEPGKGLLEEDHDPQRAKKVV